MRYYCLSLIYKKILFLERRGACSTGINRFDESNPYRKFVKGWYLKDIVRFS